MEKIAVITGGTSGLGKELKKLYESDGYRVCVLARSCSDETKDEYACDVSDEAQVTAAVEKIAAKYGRIDGARRERADTDRRHTPCVRRIVLRCAARNARMFETHASRRTNNIHMQYRRIYPRSLPLALQQRESCGADAVHGAAHGT